MQPANTSRTPEDAALAADLQRYTAQLVASLPGPAAGELHALVQNFGRLQIGTAEQLQAFIKDNCPNLHLRLDLCQQISLFCALRFLNDPHRFSASVHAVRRYVLADRGLQPVVRAMDANGGADGTGIARFFALAMPLHTGISGARLDKVVLKAIASLPGTSDAPLETGSGMTLATATRKLLVHHVLGTKPCVKPNRRSNSLAPKRRRPVYEAFMAAARTLPHVEDVLAAMSRGAPTSRTLPSSSSLPSSSPSFPSYPSSWPVAAPAPSHNVNGRRFREESSSEADYSDGSSYGSGSGSFVDEEQPRSKSPRTVWEYEEYESKTPEVDLSVFDEQQVEQEIFSYGLFHGIDNGFPVGFGQQPAHAEPVQQAVGDVVEFDGLFDILALPEEEQEQLLDAVEVNDNTNAADRQQEVDEFTLDLSELDLDRLAQFFDEDHFDAGNNNETRGTGSY